VVGPKRTLPRLDALRARWSVGEASGADSFLSMSFDPGFLTVDGELILREYEPDLDLGGVPVYVGEQMFELVVLFALLVWLLSESRGREGARRICCKSPKLTVLRRNVGEAVSSDRILASPESLLLSDRFGKLR
jgi:hypothetical protein